MEKRKPGFLESFGKSVDDTFREARGDIHDGFQQIRRGTHKIFGDDDFEETEEKSYSQEEAMKEVKKMLMTRLEDVASPASADFSYSTILSWVKNNHIGNQFYMIRYFNSNSKNTYLFVFFAKDDDLMCGKKHPMVCYIVKELPESINDLFNGKDVFIQKFE